MSAEKLCTDPQCPEVVEIPPNYGTDPVCGDSYLTDGQDVIWDRQDFFGRTIHFNTGKRFKPGIFEITNLYLYLRQEDNGDNREYYNRGRVEYTVKCQNGIKYKDSYEWETNDHRCNTYYSNCSVGTTNWIPVNPPTYDPNTLVIQPKLATQNLLFPIGAIVEQWRGREVGIPRYYGGVNKLAVPVVLINGLGYDFRAMGAVPKDAAGTEGWRKGYVSDYAQGSLPDVMSRAYGLAKGKETINHNGIYFVNLGDVEKLESRTAQYQLLDRIGEMVVDQAAGLPLTSEMKVDVVCHSSSCLLLREAIAQANSYLPANGFNPVNSIRKIITVNAPHLGSGLGKTTSEMAGYAIYDGLPEMMDQVMNPNGNQHIIDGNIDLDWSALGWDNCGPWYEAAFCWVGGQILDAMVGAEETIFDIAGANNADFHNFSFSVTGSMFGEKSADLGWFNLKTLPAPKGTNDQLVAARKAALKGNQWLATTTTKDYPKYPSGKYIDLQPFYSDRADGLETGLAREISGGLLNSVCGDGTPQCQVLEDYLQSTARSTLDNALTGAMGTDISTGDAITLHLSPTYVNLMTKLKSGWLKNSDMVVEKSSQVWNLENKKLDPQTGNPIPQLHPAITYAMHNADVPEGHPNRPVLHGPMYAMGVDVPPSANLEALDKGASLMGRDLFCALDPACAQFLGQNRPILYAGPAVKKLLPFLLPNGTISIQEAYTQVLKVEDDFDLYPQILSGPDAGIALQDAQGNTVALVRYDPLVGTSIWIAGPNGGTTQILMPPDHRPQITVQRNGDQIQTTLITQTGAKTTVSLGQFAGRTMNVVATGQGLSNSTVLFLGDAKPVDIASQTPPLAWGTVRPILEEKGQEANQSRPWIWMTNTSDLPQKGIDLAYYFTADPTRLPVVEMDYPRNLSLRTEHLAGNLWAFHVALPEIPSKKAFPDGGMQLRLHYSDWTTWVKTDDPSIGPSVPNFSEKVVLRDASGRVIWGTVPAGADLTIPVSVDTITKPVTHLSLQASWKDGGVSESNMIRPVVTVRNASVQGSLGAGYHLVLKIKATTAFTTLPVLEDWYSPSTSGTVKLASDGSLVVDWLFGPASLEPGLSVDLGQWGLHFADWRNWNKSGLTYDLSLLDANGQILLTNAQVTR